MKNVLEKNQNGESLDIKSKEILLSKNKKIEGYQKEMGLSTEYIKQIIKRCVFKNSVSNTLSKALDFKKEKKNKLE